MCIKICRDTAAAGEIDNSDSQTGNVELGGVALLKAWGSSFTSYVTV